MQYLRRLTWLHWIFGIVLGFIASGGVGIAWGYSSGVNEREKNISYAKAVDIQVQYELGLKNYQDGNYELAKQRFEYIILQNPEYPGAVEMLAESLIRISQSEDKATEVHFPTVTMISATPTMDTRAVEEIFLSVVEQWQNQQWSELPQTVVALRDLDPLYKVKEVDRMLFLALRFNGIDKILAQGNLEGGLYDLALMERFAPLDREARIYQEWARLYVLGVSFWGVFPDRSVQYFSQLASAAPFLRDASGIYAKDRYRMALIQYGDQLAKAGEWCLASEQYELAYRLAEDTALQPTMTYVVDLCLYGGESPTSVDGTPTSTLDFFTLTPGTISTATPIILTATIEPTLTPSFEVTLTPTPPEEVTPNPSPEPDITPTPSPTSEDVP